MMFNIIFSENIMNNLRQIINNVFIKGLIIINLIICVINNKSKIIQIT
jgi:hypothetical protein